MRTIRKTLSSFIAAALLAAPLGAMAGNGGNAVVGSVIGGATGAVIGNSLGGRNGAIIGGALGAAAGITIATDNNGRRYDDGRRDDGRRYDDRYDGRYDNRGSYDRYGRSTREVVVVESPRHYYQGNEFVYGVPPPPPRYSSYDNGYYNGGYNGYYNGGYNRGPNVVVIQQYDRGRGSYHGHRRW